jgi:hypothetical protein
MRACGEAAVQGGGTVLQGAAPIQHLTQLHLGHAPCLADHYRVGHSGSPAGTMQVLDEQEPTAQAIESAAPNPEIAFRLGLATAFQ